jgi:hypothetical protein
MRRRFIAVLSVLVLGALLVPSGAWAKRVTAGGSLAIAAAAGPLTNQLVATMITANRGLEKTIVQQLPLPGPIYVAPFFVNEDKDKPEQGDLVTSVLLTNATGAPLSLVLTLYADDGTVLTTSPQTLGPHETRMIALGDLLP